MKAEKPSARNRKKPEPEPEAPPRQRLNLGCGTLLIGLCLLGLLGKFLPHEPGRGAASKVAAKAAPPPARTAPEVRREPVKPPPRKPAKPRNPPETAPASAATPARPVVFNDPWDRSVAQVARYIKRGLHDASSFEAQAWGDVESTRTGYKVRCTYRSRNVLGVVATQTRTFLLDRNGEVYAVREQ